MNSHAKVMGPKEHIQFSIDMHIEKQRMAILMVGKEWEAELSSEHSPRLDKRIVVA